MGMIDVAFLTIRWYDRVSHMGALGDEKKSADYWPHLKFDERLGGGWRSPFWSIFLQIY